MIRLSRPFSFALATCLALGAPALASPDDDPKAEAPAKVDRKVANAEDLVEEKTRLHDVDEAILESLKARLPDLDALEGIAKKRLDRAKILVERFAVHQVDVEDAEVACHEASLRIKELHGEIKAAERQAIVSEFELRRAKARLERRKKSAAGASEKAAARSAETERAIAEAEKHVHTKVRLHEKEKDELDALRNQLPGLGARVANAKKAYDRYKSLAERGEALPQEFDDREAAYREMIAKALSLDSRIKATERRATAFASELQEARDRLETLKRLRGDAPERGRPGRAETERKAD